MTRQNIEKLSDKARAYCEFRQKEIRKYRASKQDHFRTEEVRMLRGYLQCLADTGALTFKEMQNLYLFYATM